MNEILEEYWYHYNWVTVLFIIVLTTIAAVLSWIIFLKKDKMTERKIKNTVRLSCDYNHEYTGEELPNCGCLLCELKYIKYQTINTPNDSELGEKIRRLYT